MDIYAEVSEAKKKVLDDGSYGRKNSFILAIRLWKKSLRAFISYIERIDEMIERKKQGFLKYGK